MGTTEVNVEGEYADRQRIQDNAGRTLGRAIGGAAVILMLGNLSTSVLGFVRQTTIAKVFGDTISTDAFAAALIVPQMFYDLTIGAAISAALIPIFTEIAEKQGRDALRRTSGSVLVFAWIVLAILIGLLLLLAGPLMSVILWGYHTHLRSGGLRLSVDIVRWLIPSLLFLGTSAVFLSTLYSVRRFTAPAFATTLYHTGIIGGALLLSGRLGIIALPVGALFGSAGQALVLVPAIIRAGVRPQLNLRLSPEVRRIGILYLPVAAGLLVSIAGQIIDLTFKSQLEAGSIWAMTLATTLTQFPIGIAVAAMSFAVLPSISSDAAFNRMDRYKDTLATGIRLVLFITIPAAVGYIVLATPIVSLLFQHGHFHPRDTNRTSLALIGYAIQIPFVGLDQLLIFSFYARRNTVTPMLVGVVGVAIYICSAVILMPRIHILGLALANTLQNSLHALILLVLLFAAVGTLSNRGVGRSVLQSAVAACVMAAGAGLAVWLLAEMVDTGRLAGQAADALIPLLFGAVLYVLVSALLGSAELRLILGLVRRKPRALSAGDENGAG